MIGSGQLKLYAIVHMSDGSVQQKIKKLCKEALQRKGALVCFKQKSPESEHHDRKDQGKEERYVLCMGESS